MREVFEFRIEAEAARLLFRPDEGRIEAGARVVAIAASDPRFARVGALAPGALRGWTVRRTFTDAERAAAEIFHLEIRRRFGPSGGACGTAYDAARACPLCGAGRRQIGTLVLRHVPDAPIAQTFAGEIVVSAALAERLVAGRFTGFEMKPVARRAPDYRGPLRLESVPSGRRLLDRARALGIAPHSYEFMLWSQIGERCDLARAAWEEASRERPTIEDSRFRQIVPTSRPVEVHASTRFGVSPFDLDEEGRHRCDRGHALGLRALSPIAIERDSHDGSDLVATRRFAGWPEPTPLILLSPRLADALRTTAGKGCTTVPGADVHPAHSTGASV